MPWVIVTAGAADGLERWRKFLAAKAIQRQFPLLETAPGIGRRLLDTPELRELAVTFWDSGYMALYRYDPDNHANYALASRHHKEAGYSAVAFLFETP